MNIRLPFGDIRVCRQPPLPLPSQVKSMRLPAFFAITLCLVLVGCATSDRRSGGTGYADRAPTNRTALVAWQEWPRFGRSTVVYGGSANGYTNRNGMSERSEPLSSRVGDYWGSCGHPEWNGSTSGRPWSGAFVAWTMSHSGVSAGDFPRVGRHGSYLASLFDHDRAGSTAFLLHGPAVPVHTRSPGLGEYSAGPCTGTA